MNEAKKTNLVRGDSFTKSFFNGSVLDIGPGTGLVCDWAQGFDLEDGDANYISQYVNKLFDTVHSSHCLEHMYDPVNALHEWWKLVKIGGYLVLVVPHEDLYEQGFWPSIFNEDHKSTFRFRTDSSWSPVSYDIESLVKALPGVNIINAEIQDHAYDYSLQSKYPPKRCEEPKAVWFIRKAIKRIPILGNRLTDKLEEYSHKSYGLPVDQTLKVALAQIQIVAQKVF